MSIICIIGRPGSGKTTLAEYVRDWLDFDYVYPGRIAREIAEFDPVFREALENGDMAPRRAMNERMRQEIKGRAPRLVVDGYPRYMTQLADLLFISDIIPVWCVAVMTSRQECIRREIHRKRETEDENDARSIAITRQDKFEEETEPVMKWFYTRMPERTVHIPGTQDINLTPIWLEEVMREAYE